MQTNFLTLALLEYLLTAEKISQEHQYWPDQSGQLHPRLVREEHISVTTEPDGSFLGHVTPDPAVAPDKPAKKAAEAVYQLLVDCDISQNCIVLGGDSTASNTGWKGGAMAHLENLLGHKCFWAIYMYDTYQ